MTGIIGRKLGMTRVFNEDGTSNVSSPIVQIVDGSQVLVWPSEFAQDDLVFPAPAFDER